METKKLKRYRLNAKDENGNYIRICNAISNVDEPAIESDFQYFSAAELPEEEYQFKVTDTELQEITGPAMIPGIDITRIDKKTNEKFLVFFTEEDVSDYMEIFLSKDYHLKANFMHGRFFSKEIFLKESWQVRDSEDDAAHALGFKVPTGTWMITYKVASKELFDEMKKSDLKGFSVEIVSAAHDEFKAHFDAVEDVKLDIQDIIEDELIEKSDKKQSIKCITEFYLSIEPFAEVGELTFNDYPMEAVQSAQRALDWKEQNPDSNFGSKIMWQRAKQIANRKPLSYANLKRISLNAKIEAKANAVTNYDSSIAIMWDAYGGNSLVDYSVKKISQIDALINAEIKKTELNRKPFHRPF